MSRLTRILPVLRRRRFTASSITTPDNPPTPQSSDRCRRVYKHIPPPTWSIADLQLDSAAEPLTSEQLSALSRRALLVVPEDSTSQQELAKMMQLIHQVVEWSQHSRKDSDEEIDPVQVYDVPRGVTAAPLRGDDDVLTENHPAVPLDKTVSVGGHKYFAIKTRGD